MPTYKFKDKETDEVTEKFFLPSKKDAYLQENPHLSEIVEFSAPALIGDATSFAKKNKKSDFGDLMKKIKTEADPKHVTMDDV